MNAERAIVEEKQGALAQKIREAEEIRDRGGMSDDLALLRQQRAQGSAELRRAINRDYLRNRQRRRQIRTKFEKIVDAMRGEA